VNISENLKHNIRESVGRHDATIVEIACRGESRAPVFDIFIDNEQGVTLDLCREVSKELQGIFEKEFPGSNYRLTVSSPGLDRPMVYPWQFRKHIGRMLEIIPAGEAGNENVTGRLMSVSETGVVLQLSAGGGDKSYAFETILSATVRPPW